MGDLALTFIHRVTVSSKSGHVYYLQHSILARRLHSTLSSRHCLNYCMSEPKRVQRNSPQSPDIPKLNQDGGHETYHSRNMYRRIDIEKLEIGKLYDSQTLRIRL